MNKHIKIGVIGGGNWGQNYVRVLEQMGVLAGLADTCETTLNKYAKKYPHLMLTDNYEHLIANRDICGVVIATPVPTHFHIAKKALLAGKDVLLEKPMTLTVDEAVELEKIAANKKQILMIGHILLYKPAVQKIIHCIRNQEIGDILFIDMQRLKLGKIRSQENALWSFAPHDIAVLLSIVEADVVKIIAYGQSALQSTVEDNVHLHLSFANNMQAHIHNCWLWPLDNRKTIVVGSKGMIVYDENEDKLQIFRKVVMPDLSIRDKGFEEYCFEDCDVLQIEVRHFLSCIQDRSEPWTDGRSGVKVVQILVEASEILQSNKQKAQYFIHDSSIIEDHTKIGEGTRIWHFCHVMNNVEIGENCNIGQNVYVGSKAKIGNNVKIQNNVSIYEGVTIENHVFCGPSVVFTNVRTPRSGYPRNKSEDYSWTIVKEGASLGANSTILCGIVIGRHALVGAGSVVTKDVRDYAIVYGNPSVQKGWICKCGEVIVNLSSSVLLCNKCGTKIKTQHGENGCL